MSNLLEKKICIVGHGNVGKSSLAIRLCNNKFFKEYDPTIEDSYVHNIDIPSNNLTIKLEICDTAGQSQYVDLRNEYMENVLLEKGGFMFVYSITDNSSFNEIKNIYNRIISHPHLVNPEVIPIVLVGNKCDLAGERAVSYEDGENMSKELGNNCVFFEASAMKDIHVSDIFNSLSERIVENKVEIDKELDKKKKKKKNKRSSAAPSEQSQLLDDDTPIEEKKKDCCTIL